MRLHSASVVMLTFLAVLAPRATFSAAQEPQSQSKAQDSKKKVASGASLSGCVDQQDGRYVLVDDRSLNPVADLEADGFPTEGFAKHMGHKVTIRGMSNSGSTRPLFKVRTIETVSETCGPTPQPDKK
jgi:hypothetical protein